MDLSKVKTILIIALVITNLLLLVNYVELNKALENKENPQEILKWLQTKKIFLENGNVKETKKMPTLAVEYLSLNERHLSEAIEKQEKVNNLTKKQAIEIAKEFLEKLNFNVNEISETSIKKINYIDSYELNFSNAVNGIKIVDSNLKVEIIDGKIETVNMHWLKPLEEGKSKRETITAVKALIKFANLDKIKESEKININNMELVYWINPEFNLILSDEESVKDTAVPAWEINYNEGETVYIYAYGA